MSNKLEELRALAEQEAAESAVDMNVAVSGGGGRLLPEGYAFGQVVEYIEFGMQPQEFGGKAKAPAIEYTMGFALWGQTANGETYHDAATGAPYIIRTYNQAIGQNEKSGAFKLFKALNWKGNKKNFAQFIGEKFLVKIVHKAKSKTDATIVSRIDPTGFLPPLDPVTRQPYAIPDAADDVYRMFIWGRPTKAAWDSLYVEGTYDAKDGKPAQSKNRIQETILAALDFQGSPLQQLLLNNGVTSLPASPVAALPATPAVVAPVAAAPAAVAPVVAPLAAAPLTPAVASVPVAATAVVSVPAAVVTPQPVTVAAVPVAVAPVAAVTLPAAPLVAAIPSVVLPA
jgi:hypothetical protein